MPAGGRRPPHTTRIGTRALMGIPPAGTTGARFRVDRFLPAWGVGRVTSRVSEHAIAPREGKRERMMGLEPTTFCMASRRSSQLSYIRVGAQYSPGQERSSASFTSRSASSLCSLRTAR
jgi:hypothetical protein